MDKIGIRQATKGGYIECSIPGCADFLYPTSKLRRGRVQGGWAYISYNNNDKRSMQDNQMGEEMNDDINRSNIYIYILGSIGNTARQNRDNMRVFSKNGVCPTLKSHISKESIMVVRKYANRDNRQ